MEFESSSDASPGGAFMETPGTFHFIVVDSQEQATDKEGKPLDGFRIVGQVLAGTVPGEKGKQCDFVFFHPKPTDKNEGAFARKKQTRCLIALAKMKPSEIGQRVSIDLTTEATVGRQFVATLEREEGKKYLRLHFADIYHVDDPDAKAFPKDAKMLEMMPKEWRFGEKDFEGMSNTASGSNGSPNGSGSGAANTNTNGNGNGSAGGTKPSKVDLDNI